MVELFSLDSNHLKKISEYKKSQLRLNSTEVRDENLASSDKDSIAHFRAKSECGGTEVSRYKQKQKILSQQERTEKTDK